MTNKKGTQFRIEFQDNDIYLEIQALLLNAKVIISSMHVLAIIKSP